MRVAPSRSPGTTSVAVIALIAVLSTLTTCTYSVERPPPRWYVVSSLSPGVLTGVAAVSASDVWAVGDYYNQATDVSQTLILHYA